MQLKTYYCNSPSARVFKLVPSVLFFMCNSALSSTPSACSTEAYSSGNVWFMCTFTEPYSVAIMSEIRVGNEY